MNVSDEKEESSLNIYETHYFSSRLLELNEEDEVDDVHATKMIIRKGYRRISLHESLMYDVPNNDGLKRKLLSYAGEQWKAFNTSLTSRYVFGELKTTNTCEEYTYLNVETCHAFL
ncbi:hypothetical protein L6164_028389 [Bauhinia variegata]|uniref:Uncharacterized protein n=1 Tax=Bauhinia variegata TaxID=167791 RepID=A0ACB9L5R2_BAUVA|nr:hypothetical protein L6164_028389 [Bauhinia variegata]